MLKKAYLIQDKSNIYYLTGFEGSSGIVIETAKITFLITNALYYGETKRHVSAKTKVINSNDLLTDIKKILASQSIDILYYEEPHILHRHFLKFKKELKGITLNPQSDHIEKLRVQKTPREISMIKKALNLAELTMIEVTKKLHSDVTEKEVAWQIEQTGRKLGADDISFEPIVAFGSHTSVPHHKNSTAKLKKGMPLLIDMGLKYKGYCSDLTRTFFTKPPTTKEVEIYNTVLEAQLTAEKHIKAGVSSKKADAIARNVISKAGYGNHFTHSLGHGIGLDVHESPTLSAKSTDRLPQNSIVTLEPGIYIENFFGVRIEDMVLVERNKVKNLTKIPKKLENLLLKIT